MSTTVNHPIPVQPEGSHRVVLELPYSEPRLDSVLMKALRTQGTNLNLMNVSRGQFKKLFKEKRILIKGQPANAASSIAQGTTYVDILGY
jgi:hypothetical protein